MGIVPKVFLTIFQLGITYGYEFPTNQGVSDLEANRDIIKRSIESPSNLTSHRESKFLPLISTVQFKADPCFGTGDEQGICVDFSTCHDTNGGRIVGNCASGT